MTLRKNALLGAARMVEAVHQVAMAHAPDAVGTVGLMEVKPTRATRCRVKCSSRSICATRMKPFST